MNLLLESETCIPETLRLLKSLVSDWAVVIPFVYHGQWRHCASGCHPVDRHRAGDETGLFSCCGRRCIRPPGWVLHPGEKERNHIYSMGMTCGKCHGKRS